MSIKITDKTENITITFIRFNDVFGKVVAVEGWQSYQEALDEQAPEYGIKQPQKVAEVWYKGERIYNNERSK